MGEALLVVGYALLFCWWVGASPFFRLRGAPAWWPMAILLSKFAAGTALWYVYTYVHTDRATADIYRYFDDGRILFDALAENPGDFLRMLTGIGDDAPHIRRVYYEVMNNWYRQYESGLHNDAHTMIRASAVMHLFSFGHYHVHTLFACMFSMIGLTALHTSLAPLLPGQHRALAMSVFLLPSVLFWGSGAIKEPLLLCGLGLFVSASVGDYQAKRRLVFGTLGLALLIMLKVYVLLSLLPSLLAYWWCRRSTGAVARKFLLTAAACTGLVLGVGHMFPACDVLEFMRVKQKDFIGVAVATQAGSYLELKPLSATMLSFTRAIPHALYMTFLSPLTLGGQSSLALISALETMLLLAAVGLALFRRKPWTEVDKPLLGLCVGFCVTLALVIGWTTPVVGALVRYRVPLLPFLLVAALVVMTPFAKKNP
jgi:hypothetical protein